MHNCPTITTRTVLNNHSAFLCTVVKPKSHERGLLLVKQYTHTHTHLQYMLTLHPLIHHLVSSQRNTEFLHKALLRIRFYVLAEKGTGVNYKDEWQAALYRFIHSDPQGHCGCKNCLWFVFQHTDCYKDVIETHWSVCLSVSPATGHCLNYTLPLSQ